MTEPVARLRIELREIEPRLWRRIDVPVSSTLLALHDIIQIAVGWTDSHLFEFVIRDRVYGEPMPDDDFWDRHVYKAAGIRLKTLIERGVERFLYVNDFGDDWRHDIFIESVRDGEADVDYPAFVGGERRCPPEDIGGVPGFMEFLEAALDPLHVGAQRGGDLVREAVRPGRHRRARRAAEACHAGRPPPGRPREASRRSAVRFDLTHIRVPLWTATGRQLGLLSTVSLRTDCYRTTGTGRRRPRCRTRRCSERHRTPPGVVPA